MSVDEVLSLIQMIFDTIKKYFDMIFGKSTDETEKTSD